MKRLNCVLILLVIFCTTVFAGEDENQKTVLYAGTQNGNLEISKDDGQSWQATTPPDGSAVNSIFVKNGTLYAGTQNGNIKISTTYGATWTATTQPGGAILSLFVSGSTLYASTNNYPGIIFVSTDKGKSWTNMSVQNNRSIPSIIINGTTLYAPQNTNDTQYIAVSTNSGKSWSAINPPIHYDLIHSICINNNDLYLALNLKLLKTHDAGKTWSTVDTSKSFEKIFANNKILYGIDNLSSHVINFSSDQGQSWLTTNRIDGSRVTSIFVTSKSILAGTDKGNLAISTNNGQSWTLTSTPDMQSKLFSITVNGSTVYAGTQNANVVMSTDGGKTWDTTKKPDPNSNGITGIFVDGTTLYATAQYPGDAPGKIFYSNNGGNTWQQHSAPDEKLSGLFVQNQTLYVGSNQNDIGHINISDKGNSWVQVKSPDNSPVNSISVQGANLYAGTDNGHVMFTENNAATPWQQVGSTLNSPVTSMFIFEKTTLYVGSHNGNFRYATGGKNSWSDWNIAPSQPDGSAILSLFVSDFTF